MTEFLGAWRVDLFVAVNLLLGTAWYLWAVRRVNTRHPRARWHWGLTASFLSGMALLSLMYVGPMAAWSHTFFWVHMTQHLVVTMAVAPLLVLGAPITLAFRASGPRNRRAIVRVLRTRAVTVMTNPIVTWLLFAGVLLGAHFTAFYNWSLENHGASVLVEQPMFLVVAVLYYLPLIGSNLLPRRPPHAVRLISLGLMMIPEALIGAVIYFSPVVLYPAFDVERPFGLAPLPDQQLSGALMWALVMVVDAFWMMWVAAEWFASEERRGRRISAEIEAEVAAGVSAG